MKTQRQRGKRPVSRSTGRRTAKKTRTASLAARRKRTSSAKAGTPSPTTGAQRLLAASTDVLLSMPQGPSTLVTVGDVYRKDVPKDVLARAGVVLNRTQAARLKLEPGDHYYVFDVQYAAGAFTLKASRGSIVFATKDCSTTSPTGSPFDFTVS